MPVIKYGSYDGYAVRFTRYEAWILADGHWQKTGVAQVLHEAALLTKEQFHRVYGALPPMPSAAFQSPE